MSDGPVLPALLWRRLQAVLGAVRERGATCRVVVVINCKRGEPVDGDILATEPPAGVESA